MNCLNKTQWLSYLKGEIEENERGELSRHLEQCAECRDLARELKMVFQTLDGLDKLDGLEPGPGFTAKVKQEILGLRQVRGWERILLPALASAAAVLSLGLGIFLGQSLYSMLHSDESTRNSTQTANLYYEGAAVEFYDNGGI